MSPSRSLTLVTWLAAALMAGCGGGSSSSTDSSTDSSTGGTSTTTTTTTSGDTEVAPAITAQPASVSVTEGAAASFSVTATGSGTLTYQWRKGGTAIAGATSATYTVSAAASSDAGSYDVVVANSVGSATSAAATLTVTSDTSSAVVAPAIATSPTSQSVTAGATVSFSVAATGTAPLSYQWARDGVALSGATSATYTIAAAAASDAGSYTVTVTNSAGSATSAAATLSVTTSTTSSGTLAADTVAAAQSFLATLSTSQQASVVQTWSLAAARKWSNLPAAMVSRNGLAWSSLSTAQQTAARAMITVALGTTGNALHLASQKADDALVSLYGAGSGTYGGGHYYIAMLGTPSSTGQWMLQLTGHHMTFNVSFNGSYWSGTPMFLGVEPKGSFTLDGSTWDPMAAQRTAVSALGAALTSYSGAKLSGSYGDILFGANGSGNIDGTCPRSYSSVTEHGLAYSSLSSAHKALALAVIRAYVQTQADEISTDMLAAYLSDTALAQTYVAYTGTGTVTANGNYFRIEGPRVWIEFSVQRGVIISSDIHYHTIWRDKTADYGGACL